MPPARIIFSDIDGTIMHDPREQRGEPGDLLVTPPSASGRQGAISVRSIQQVAELRKQGAKFVVITGARLSTLLMRLPYLPAADAFVCENGGRVFYPGSSIPTACPVTEDSEWRAIQSAAGPADQDCIQPGERRGLLWEWFQKLHGLGWTMDANGYTTSFRVHAKNGKTMEELQQLIPTAPSGLACSFNLGAADFYPNTSGKCPAASYLMKHFGAQAADCVFLCDDDNDMELAAVVGKAFLPSISSDSVTRAVEANPGQFIKAQASGTAATEEMLDAVAAFYGLTMTV